MQYEFAMSRWNHQSFTPFVTSTWGVQQVIGKTFSTGAPVPSCPGHFRQWLWWKLFEENIGICFWFTQVLSPQVKIFWYELSSGICGVLTQIYPLSDISVKLCDSSIPAHRFVLNARGDHWLPNEKSWETATELGKKMTTWKKQYHR